MISIKKFINLINKMNINDWVNRYTQRIDKDSIKFIVNGDKDINKSIGNYILSQKIVNVDLSNCNLTYIPDFIIEIIEKLNTINLSKNKIKSIPIKLMDLNLNKLEKFEIFDNPVLLKDSIFKDSRDFLRNVYSTENKKYMMNNRKKYNNFKDSTDKAISKYIFNLYNDLNIGTLEFKNDNTNNLIDLINIHKNIRYRNYDYVNNNNLHKFVVKSIFNFLFQLSTNPLNYNIKGIDIDDIYDLSKNLNDIFVNDELRKKFMNLIENIFLSEFLFNDENAVRLLGKGSYNIAYELSEEYNLYIIKQLMNLKKSRLESYKEFLISTILMYNVGNILPNFTDPICIFNLKKNETKVYDEFEVINKDPNVPKYLCEFDEKYYFSSSQYIFDKKSSSKRKTILNKSSNSEIENYYMTRNVEYGITLDKYMTTLYSLPEEQINTKILNIILQIIRAISISYCKIGFYHGDGHCQNILVNTLDDSTFIQEMYINPFVKYKYHKTKEVVTFIDYGMSNLYLNKTKKDSSENIIMHLSIQSHDEMANPIVDIHRMYYSIVNDLYRDIGSNKYPKNKVLHVVKMMYMYLGGFFYDNKRVQYDTPLNVIDSLVKLDLRTNLNGKIYYFGDYDAYNFGYMPTYVDGIQRDKINSCFDIYNYFFIQYRNNINKASIDDEYTELTMDVEDDFMNEFLQNSKEFEQVIRDVNKNKDQNVKYLDDIIKYKMNKQLSPNEQYKDSIDKLINFNQDIYDFVNENLKSIFLTLDKNTINDANINELTKSFEYLTKSMSIYINNLRKLCYYNTLNHFSNKLTLNMSYFDPSNIMTLLTNLLNYISSKNIPRNSNINMYVNVIRDFYQILKSSKFNTGKNIKAPGPIVKQKYTSKNLNSKTIKELKDIFSDLQKMDQSLVNKFLNRIGKPISKFIKDDYVKGILYVTNN